MVKMITILLKMMILEKL